MGLYNISTLAAYRRRGFGTALTLRPLLDARAQGYRTAILQAQGSDGVGVYARLGFEPFGEITEYKPGNQAAWADTSRLQRAQGFVGGTQLAHGSEHIGQYCPCIPYVSIDQTVREMGSYLERPFAGAR